jgi:hypothetical protein
VIPVVLEVIAVNEYVIEVGSDKDIQIWASHVIDEVLEIGGGIGQAKGHN